jgi:hypothetical protein
MTVTGSVEVELDGGGEGHRHRHRHRYREWQPGGLLGSEWVGALIGGEIKCPVL